MGLFCNELPPVEGDIKSSDGGGGGTIVLVLTLLEELLASLLLVAGSNSRFNNEIKSSPPTATCDDGAGVAVLVGAVVENEIGLVGVVRAVVVVDGVVVVADVEEVDVMDSVDKCSLVKVERKICSLSAWWSPVGLKWQVRQMGVRWKWWRESAVLKRRP